MMLEVRDLNAYYGKSHILHGVNFTLEEGEVVSLLGRNGVGRSTTVKSIMGEVPPHGSIRFRGNEIAGLPNHKISRLGLGYVPENRDIFPTLTVRQNLELGVKNPRKPGKWRAEQMLEMFPNLAQRADAPAGVLSGGDEPTEGLAPLIVKQIGDLISEIAKAGVSILLVEQKLSIAMDISHRVLVMGHGQIVFEGTPQELRADEAIRREWLEV